MSWSTSSIDCPASARRRSRRPSSSLSCVSSPAAGSSRHRTRGFATSARAIPTSLRWPCESSLGIASATPARPSSSSTGAVSAESARGVETVSPIVRQTEGRCAATSRFSRTVRSSNSSIDCHVRASPRRARACGGRPVRSSPSSSTRPCERTKPVIASMKVVLPAPFGPIRPTSCPSPTSRSTSTTACTPPKLTEIPVASGPGSSAVTGHVDGAHDVRRSAGGRGGHHERLRLAAELAAASSRTPTGTGG